MRVVEGIATVDDVDGFVTTLSRIGVETGCSVQAFDANYVVSREHLERALALADRAFDRGENVARDRSVELLLYAAGRRQIDQALEMGVGEETLPVAVVVAADTEDGDEAAAEERVAELLDPADTLGDYDDATVREFFDISQREVGAAAFDLDSLVLERVALLDVEK